MNTLKQVICHKCKEPIKSIDNLALGFVRRFVITLPAAYHKGCYDYSYESPWVITPPIPHRRIRYPQNHPFSIPLFSLVGLLGIFILGLIGRAMVLEPPTNIFTMLFFTPFILVGLFFLNLAIARMLGYYRCEKPLKEKKYG